MLSSLLCCLNMSLSCPPYSPCSSPLSFPTTKPQFDMQVLAPSLSLSQTILDCGGESASLSACCNFLATYIIHVCLWLCVWEIEERVKRLRLLLMRIAEPTATTTTMSQISLGTSFDLSFTAKTHLSTGGTCFHPGGN